MPRACFFSPHIDDELLSMWPYMHLLAAGYDVHIVFMSRGAVTPEAILLNGVDPNGVADMCNLPDHPYIHDPQQEGYAPLTQEDIGLIRLREGIASAGIASRIPPTAGTRGKIFCHDANLPLQWGNGSGHGVPTEDGIQAALTVIKQWIDDLPNTFFYTMSPTDKHPDHAACGIALRRLKGEPVYHGNGDFTFTGGDPNYAPLLLNAEFFASKLYWGDSITPRDPDLLQEYCAWYPNYYPQNSVVLPRRSEYTTYIRNKVVKPYVSSWVPADVTTEVNGQQVVSRGTFCVGGHQVYSQFYNAILNPSLSVVSALWHP